jgi:hypothetical protein
MPFFRIGVSSAGPVGWETAAYFGKFPNQPGQQQLLETRHGLAPGAAITLGPYELDDNLTWQSMFQQARTTNAVISPGMTVSQVIEWSNTPLGPWTHLCTQTVPQVGAAGFFDLAFCDLNPAFPVVIVPCTYGTRPKDSAQLVVFLTQEAITAALATLLLPELAVILIPAAVGLYLNKADLCGALPPTVPQMELSDITNPGAKLAQIIAVIMWPTFCECAPGTPAPTPPPPPEFVFPPGWAVPPTYACSNEDLCAVLVQLQQKIDVINAAVQRVWLSSQLNQRYRLPFASVPGAVHSNLVGQGSFAISRLVGVRVDITEASPTAVWEGEPEYLKDVAWCSVSDEGAMLQEFRVTRGRQDFYPAECQLATRFGWFCKNGTVLRVTELEPEAPG